MLKIFNKFKTEFKWQTGLIIGLTIITYGFLVNNINLWLDEIYSVLMAKDSFSQMWILLTTEDSKPPLYYLYLKLILCLFPKIYEIAAAHFGSVILLIAAQIFSATAVKRDYGEKTSLWLMILIALLPQSLWLGLEVRTYMLSSLLLLTASVYGARLTNKPQNADYVKFGLVSVLALYSHYYCALYLMFLYGLIFVLLIKEKKIKASGVKFVLTAISVALLFAPWLWVPFHTAQNISKIWYVHNDFVRFSWQFFTNPLQPEIIQSVYFIATTFSTSVFSFLLVLGLVNALKFEAKSKKIIILTMGCFCLTYALLFFLSATIRPMVTARYLKIFSVPLYLSGAVVLAKYKEIGKAIFTVLLIGFYFTFIDVRAISFDEGYQIAIHDVREYLSPQKPLLVTDNSNLFCEYYLPEYKCLLLASENGEILRFLSIQKNISDYDFKATESMFSFSLYEQPAAADECSEYKSYYRYGQNIRLCRFDKLAIVDELLNKSRDVIRKRIPVLDY